MLRLLDTPPSPDAPRASTSPRKRGDVKAARADAPRVIALSSDSRCQTAMRNPPRPLVGATVAVVFPALARRGPPPSRGQALPLAKPRGGAPSGASSIALHTLRRARPLGEG